MAKAIITIRQFATVDFSVSTRSFFFFFLNNENKERGKSKKLR